MVNREIRLSALDSGVKLYEIAHALGILDCNFSRKLRYELPTEEKEKIMKIISELAAKRTKKERG